MEKNVWKTPLKLIILFGVFMLLLNPQYIPFISPELQTAINSAMQTTFGQASGAAISLNSNIAKILNIIAVIVLVALVTIVLKFLIEKLTPEIFASEKNNNKKICANVDMYSGLVYRMLGIPEEMFTPLFAIARVSGWCAHRLEELISGGKIIRPGYKAVMHKTAYVPMEERS